LSFTVRQGLFRIPASREDIGGPMPFFSAAFLFACLNAPTVRIVEPLDLWAPESVAIQWNSFDDTKLDEDSFGVPVLLSDGNAPSGRGRIDVLRRSEGKWVWTGTARYSSAWTIRQSDDEQRIIVRFEKWPCYFAGDLPAKSFGPLRLKRMKNVTISDGSTADVVAFYSSWEESPRQLGRGEHVFRGVPASEAIVCATVGLACSCNAVTDLQTVVRMEVSATATSRVLKLESQASDELHALARGRVAIRPVNVEMSVKRAGPWAAVELGAGAPSWGDIVIDRASPELALERVAGSALMAPPEFFAVAARPQRGLIVRPRTGKDATPLEDHGAMLVVFGAASEAGTSEIPLAIATPAEDGAFRLPTLASDTYRLKVMSSNCAPDVVPATLTVGVPGDVIFRSGPRVTGHVSRLSGGAAIEPVRIEVAAEQTKGNAAGADLLDGIRFATAGDDGSFSVVLGLPGRYLIRAQWGAARAERTFEIAKTMADVDLGGIVLSSGLSLHGFVRGCANGEAILIAVPSLSNPAASLDELLRAPVDADGRFVVQGLTVGQWSVLFRCAGVVVTPTPEVITLADTDVVLDFRIPPPSGDASKTERQ
jgi:hypothetical protein